MALTKDEAYKRQSMALNVMRDSHYPGCKGDPDNCAACAIRTGGEEGPNYAGWARVYVEAGQPIPGKWRDAFERERHSDNKAYAQALEESIAHFGYEIK